LATTGLALTNNTFVSGLSGFSRITNLGLKTKQSTDLSHHKEFAVAVGVNCGYNAYE
jgi:hypothetical protein